MPRGYIIILAHRRMDDDCVHISTGLNRYRRPMHFCEAATALSSVTYRLSSSSRRIKAILETHSRITIRVLIMHSKEFVRETKYCSNKRANDSNYFEQRYTFRE